MANLSVTCEDNYTFLRKAFVPTHNITTETFTTSAASGYSVIVTRNGTHINIDPKSGNVTIADQRIVPTKDFASLVETNAKLTSQIQALDARLSKLETIHNTLSIVYNR